MTPDPQDLVVEVLKTNSAGDAARWLSGMLGATAAGMTRLVGVEEAAEAVYQTADMMVRVGEK